MVEAEAQWTIGVSALPLSHGLPLAPVAPPPKPDQLEVFEWGATSVPWPASSTRTAQAWGPASRGAAVWLG